MLVTKSSSGGRPAKSLTSCLPSMPNGLPASMHHINVSSCMPPPMFMFGGAGYGMNGPGLQGLLPPHPMAGVSLDAIQAMHMHGAMMHPAHALMMVGCGGGGEGRPWRVECVFVRVGHVRACSSAMQQLMLMEQHCHPALS